MDGLIEVIMDELGQTSRFENWEDINIFKKLGVSDFNELKVALPSERTVAGEAVEGNMDVIIELENNITIPSGESIEYMTKFIVPDGVTLTVSDGAVLSCGMENDGCVNVLSGGQLATTMGGAIINRNELTVNEGAELTSQMGGEVINENGATLTLDGTFNCGCYGFEGNDVCWFENSGTVSGSGNILLYVADAETMPVGNIDALTESVAQMISNSEISVEIDDWKPTLFACVDGVVVDPSKPYKIDKGKSVFVTFYTLDENVNHGYAPIAGWADCYPGGMLSSKGFSVTEGNASDFGYNAVKDWGFAYDPHGFLLSAGDLAVGTKGSIDYFLYICDNFSWETFDFVNTPHGLTETLTFEVEDHHWDGGKKTKAATYTATGVKTYTCTECGQTKNETLAKLPKQPNTLSVKAKKPSVKFAKLKKKNQTIALKKWVTVSKAQGKVTYKKSSGNKKITVSKAGKITVKKGLKKGTYKVKIKVTAAGNASYKPATKTVTVTIKVK